MKRFLKYTFWACSIIVLLLVCGAVVLWYMWSSNLPYIGSLEEYNPPIISEMYDKDGRAVGRFWDEKRILVSLDELPEHLIEAFVAAEDARFFEHEGLDLPGIIRALVANLRSGRIEQGGSTITQQVTKSLLLKNPEKTYRRKVREATLSLQIERAFSKERILYLYLNQIYLGHGAYGVEAAARTYFGKSAKDLTLSESSILAGLPQAPSRYSLILHYEKAKARQRYVLQRMREEGYITDEAENEAFESVLFVEKGLENSYEAAPYFVEHVRKSIVEKYGRDWLYKGGFKIHTTLDLTMQKAAQSALIQGLEEFDKREGYRGPLRQISIEDLEKVNPATAAEDGKTQVIPLRPGLVREGLVLEVNDQRATADVQIGEEVGLLSLSNMLWARSPNPKVAYYGGNLKKVSKALQPGDIILVKTLKKTNASDRYQWELSLEQKPEIQGALFSIEAESGRVKAMVGGRDFFESQFNRAVQARRQPGSAFKPIIYAAALDWGMNPATVIIDSPYISTMESKEELWRPKNYKEKFFGPTLFRTALAKSRNVITVKILETIGLPYILSYARKLGVESELSSDLSLALGSSGISLAEITKAYAVFANGGFKVEPYFVERIEDRQGNVIEENQPILEETISPETAFVMTDILKAVVQEGTGWRIKALKRPTAGKTGTTNDLKDAWYIGYTPGLVAGVWVGYDDQKPMGNGETGSRAASPIWLYFMSEVLKDQPIADFIAPEGIVFAKIDLKTGLLASPHSKKTVFQAFQEGTEPKEHTPTPKSAKSGQFSQFDMEFMR